MIQINNILFPTDFSSYAEYAQNYAVELAKTFNATLIAIHVSQPSYPIDHPPFGLADADFVSLNKKMDEGIHDTLRQLEEKLLLEGIKVQTEVRMGKPFVEIISYARESAVDLIVIATHGHGAVAQLMLGSTAEKVVRKAPCPVLTIRHPEHEFIKP